MTLKFPAQAHEMFREPPTGFENGAKIPELAEAFVYSIYPPEALTKSERVGLQGIVEEFMQSVHYPRVTELQLIIDREVTAKREWRANYHSIVSQMSQGLREIKELLKDRLGLT